MLLRLKRLRASAQKRLPLGIAGLFILLVTASCGYQWGDGAAVSCYRTVCVPYVRGDQEGRVTNALIKKMSASGTLRYCHKGGDLVLQVKLIDFREENIGFRYDRNANGELTENVIPTETRVTALAEVTVTERCSDCVVVGPDLVTTFVDYDHDYYSNHGGINVFSLGQLNDLDLARQEAYRPLSEALAERIVDHVNNAW